MRRVLRLVVVAAVLCTAVWSGGAIAGSRPATGAARYSDADLVLFAKRIEMAAAERGARVFIVARQGVPADALPKGIEFTHTALAVYSTITTTDGRTLNGYAIHNLYQRADRLDRSELVQDYPADFFRAAHELKAGIAIPTPALQRRLLQVIQSETYRRLHNPRYSTLANPYDRRFQNCTEFVLDVLQAAIYRTGDIDVIKANNRAYFDAEPVRVAPLKLLFGSLTMEDLTLSDHSERVRTATFGSIVRYLDKYGLLDETVIVGEEG